MNPGPKSRQRLAIGASAAAVAMAVVIGVLFLIDAEEPLPRGDGPPVIAVLPFEVIGLAEGDPVVDGFHHDLLARLSRLHAFDVISRTSVLDYSGRSQDGRRIGRALGADFIVVSSIELVEGGVRLEVRLIDGAGADVLWNATYAREFSAPNLFAIQSELAAEFASRLGVALSPGDTERLSSVPTRSTDAYTAYLTGIGLLGNAALGTERAGMAQREFERAVQADADFAAPWVELVRSSAYWSMIWPDEQAMLDDVTRFMESLETTAPGSYAAGLARVYFQYYAMRDLDGLLPAIDALEQRGPLDAEVHYIRGTALRRTGQLQHAYHAYRAASRLDPRPLVLKYDLLATAMLLGDCDLAGTHASAMLATSPDHPSARTAAAYHALQCDVDTERASELVAGFEAANNEARWLSRLAAILRHENERALTLFGTGESVHAWWGDDVDERLIRVYLLKQVGSDDDAERELDTIEKTLAESKPDDSLYQQITSALLRFRYSVYRGDPAEVDRWAAELDRLLPGVESLDLILRSSVLQGLAFAYAEAGMNDKTVDTLERLFAGPSFITMRFVDAHPLMDALHDHPRYRALMEAVANDR